MRIPKTIFEAIFLVGHDEDFWAPEPELPTDAPPGSIEKIDVFRERLLRGESLWHPDDNRTCATKEQQSQSDGIVKDRLKQGIYSKRQKAF